MLSGLRACRHGSSLLVEPGPRISLPPTTTNSCSDHPRRNVTAVEMLPL
jgi:hypothetical protein